MDSIHPSGVKLEHSACPNGCTPDDKYILKGYDRLHEIEGCFSLVRCQSCNLERTNPRPTSDTIGAYYPADYAPYHATINTEQAQPKIKSWLRTVLGLAAKQIPPVAPGRMLDVGCASGGYMEHMQCIGWTVEGIEFSESAAFAARKKGFKVQISSLEEAESPSVPYDVITAWMVLEHLHQPIQCLKRMRNWIKPNGFLVASVPDAESLASTLFKERSYDLHLPNHLYHFTPKTLERLLNNAGWTIGRIVWQKNCNALLWSAEYWAKDMNHTRVLNVVRWLRTSSRAGKMRLMLGWLLGVTHQSGRIEIWARPAKPEGNK